MDILSLVYLPINIFLLFPALTLVPAIGFLAVFLIKKRVSILGASAIWFAYGSWEWYMHQWSKTVIAPIRIDLLVIVPILYFITAFGLFYSLQKCQHKDERKPACK